jgi:hypothetical protein
MGKNEVQWQGDLGGVSPASSFSIKQVTKFKPALFKIELLQFYLTQA